MEEVQELPESQKTESQKTESQKTESESQSPLHENKLFVGHCINVLKTIQSGCIDVAITSPPYDDLRAYKGNYKLDLTELGKEVFRVLKDGGILSGKTAGCFRLSGFLSPPFA